MFSVMRCNPFHKILQNQSLISSIFFILIASQCRAEHSLRFSSEKRNVDISNTNFLEHVLRGHANSLYKTDRNNGVDPDAKRNLTELIRHSGYPVEVYTVQTADGFLLDVHRIPHGRQGSEHMGRREGHGTKQRPVVFLQHALLSSACDWVMNFANDSLGFILADSGYDVWMGNSRGNTYSRRHISLSPDDVAFWVWSFDEMAKYDMPAFIDFVLNKTGQSSLSLIGHSQGTMMNFALLSERPDIGEKVNLFIALAPATYVSHIKSPILYMSLLSDDELYSHFGRKGFLPSDETVKFLVDLLCTDELTRWMCDNILFLLVGTDFKNLNQSRIDVYFNHSPAGVSVRDMVHFAQMYRESQFAKYDYGSRDANMIHYNQPTPPVYDMSKVEVPVVLFSAGEDWLADPQDVRLLVNALPNLKAWYLQPNWNHMDFVWGLTAAEGCYARVLDWLRDYHL